MSEIELLPWQQVVVAMALPRLLVHAGRQTGKSTVVAAIAKRTDIGQIGVFLGNHLMMEELKRKSGDAPNVEFHNIGGSPAWVGKTFNTVIFDEPGFFSEAAVNRVAPLLAFADRALLIGSPSPRLKNNEPHWFERVWRGGAWFTLGIPTSAAGLMGLERRDELRSAMGDKLAAIELDGKFSDAPLPPPKPSKIL